MKTNTEMSKGDTVSWETWGGEKYEGIVTDVEDDCIHVKCTDGIERAVNNSSHGM